MGTGKEIRENKGAALGAGGDSKKGVTAVIVIAVIVGVVLVALLFMINLSNKGYESAFPSSGLSEEPKGAINTNVTGLKGFLLFGGDFYAPADAEEMASGHILYKTGDVYHVVRPVNKIRSETLAMTAEALSGEGGFSYDEARVESGYHGDRDYIYSAGICSNINTTYYVLSYSYRTYNGNMILFTSFSGEIPNDKVRDDTLLSTERYIDGSAPSGTEGQGSSSGSSSGSSGGNGSSSGNGDSSKASQGGTSSVSNDGSAAKYNAQRYIDRIKTKVGELDENGGNDIQADYRVSYDMSKETQHFYIKYSNARAVPSYAFIRSPSGQEYDADFVNANKLGEIYFVIDKPEKGVWSAFFGPADYGTYTCGIITQEQYIKANDPNNEQYPKE